jgi:hypothetical protein
VQPANPIQNPSRAPQLANKLCTFRRVFDTHWLL